MHFQGAVLFFSHMISPTRPPFVLCRYKEHPVSAAEVHLPSAPSAGSAGGGQVSDGIHANTCRAHAACWRRCWDHGLSGRRSGALTSTGDNGDRVGEGPGRGE